MRGGWSEPMACPVDKPIACHARLTTLKNKNKCRGGPGGLRPINSRPRGPFMTLIIVAGDVWIKVNILSQFPTKSTDLYRLESFP